MAASSGAMGETPVVQETEYVLSRPIVVGNGRELELKLHGKALGNQQYGIREIEVWNGQKRIQTIPV